MRGAIAKPLVPLIAQFEKDSSAASLDRIRTQLVEINFDSPTPLDTLLAYCQSVPSCSALQTAVLEVDRSLTNDRAGIKDLIEPNIAKVLGGGSVPDATGICMMVYPRLTKAARHFLQNRPLVKQLGEMPEPVQANAVTPAPAVTPIKALWKLLHGDLTGVLSIDGSKGKPPETKVEPKPEELAQFTQLKTLVLSTIPAPDPKVPAPTTWGGKKASDPKQFADLRAKIKEAPPIVGEMLAKDPEVQARLINTLGPDQRAELANDLDPIARLTAAIHPPWVQGQPAPKQGDAYTLIHDFLVQHPGEGNAQVRSRVLVDTALLMEIRRLSKEQQDTIQRLVARGTEAKQPVDVIYEGKPNEALAAAIELSADRAKLAELQGDTMFRQYIDTNPAMLDKKASAQGLVISVHDFMARAWGQEPGNGKDPNLGTQGDWVNGDLALKNSEKPEDRKKAEEAAKPLSPDEWKALNAVVDGAVGRLAPRLESHWYSADAWTNDDGVVQDLLQYERDVAKDEIKGLFPRANLSPGPELVKRANADARVGDIRTKLGKCLGEAGRQVCERVLGIRADSAAVGQVNGKVRLADDAKTGKVPLPQALAEVTVATEVKLSERTVPAGAPLTQLVHIAAEDMARELNEWSADKEDVDLINNNFLAAFNAKSAELAERAGLDKKDTSLNGLGTELLRNAFREVPKGGDLRTKIQEALGKTDGAAATKAMKLEAEDDRARAKATASPQEAAAEKFTDKAVALFAAFGQYSEPFGGEEGSPSQDSLNAERKKSALAVKLAYEAAMAPTGPAPAPAPAQAATQDPTKAPAVAPAAPASADVGTFKDFYHQKYGIDPQRHLVELARNAYKHARDTANQHNGPATGDESAPKKKEWREPTVAEFSEMFGLPPGSFEAATGPVAPPPELAKLDEANKQKAGEGAKKLWDAVHGTGDIIQIRRDLEKERREVQLTILGLFRQLSGGIDLDFYIQQALGHHANRIGGEGARAQGAEVSDKADARVTGDESSLKEVSSITQTGTVAFLVRVDVALKNANRDELFRLADNATPDERRAVIGSPKHMNELREKLPERDFDRVYGVLNGSADLVTRLAARTEGSTVPTTEASDQKGMQRDIKDWVARRTEQYIRDREAKKNTYQDPEIKEIVKVELQRMYQDVALQGLIENEVNSWWNARGSASDLQSRLLNGGEEQHTSKFLNDGSWTSSSDILESIKAMPADERAKLRTNPQFLKKLDDIAMFEGDYKRQQIIRALQGSSDGNEGSLVAVQEALAASDTAKLLEAVSHLTPSELKRVQADPSMVNRILNAAYANPEKTAALRQMLTFNPAEAKTGIAGKNFTSDPIEGEIAPEERERLAFLQHSAEARIRSGTFGTWEQLANEAIAVYKMDFKPVGKIPETPGAAPVAPDMNKNAKETYEQSVARVSAPTLAEKHAQEMRGVVWAAVDAEVTACVKKDRKKQFNEEQQIAGIREGILGRKDPTAQLTQYLVSPTFLGDNSASIDEDSVEKALTGASDQLIVDEWSSVLKPAFGSADGRPLKAVYEDYRKSRDADTSKPENKAKADAARLAYQRFVIQPSQEFEHLVLPGTRKLVGFDPDVKPTESKDQNANRDNSQYAKYRAIMNDRIKGLNTALVARAIGADGHDAAVLGSGIRTAEQGLAAATEAHGQQRLSGNQDGDEGRQMDRALGDYNRAVQKSEDKTAGDRDPDGAFSDLPDQDKRENAKLDAEFAARKEEFVAAREKSAELAALVVSVLVGVILTAVLPGAGSLAAAALYGALVSAAAATGQVLTKEAILGNTYDASGDGLKTIVSAAATGAIAGGAQFYGGQIVNALAPIGPTGTAAQQAQALATAAGQEAPMWRQILQEGGKGMAQGTITGVANTAGSMIEPTHWLHGWNEGWRRAKAAGAAEIAKLPGDAVRMGLASMAGAFASKGAQKLGYPQGQPLKPGEIPGMTGVAKQFANDLPSNVGMALVDNALQHPETPGALASALLTTLATNARDMKQGMDGGAVAHNLHQQQADAHVARQILAHQDRFVSGAEAAMFRQAVQAAAESGSLPTASEFLSARDVIAGAGIKTTLSAEQAEAFRRWVRKAPTTAEFLARKERNPLEVLEVAAAKPAAEAKRDAPKTAAGSSAETHAATAKTLAAKGRDALGATDALETQYQKEQSGDAAKTAFDKMGEHLAAAKDARIGLEKELGAAKEALAKAGTADEKKEIQAVVDEITDLLVHAQSAEVQIALARMQMNNAVESGKLAGGGAKKPPTEPSDNKKTTAEPVETKPPPVVDTAKLTPEEYADFSILVKELGPEKGALKFREQQEKKQAELAKKGAGEINASFIQGSDFIAQDKATLTHQQIGKIAGDALLSSLAGVIPGVKSIVKMGADTVVEMVNGDMFKVNIGVTQLGPTALARSWLNTERLTHVIQLNENIAENNIERATAHEVAELIVLHMQMMGGAKPTNVDALAPGKFVPNAQLSGHDMGRLAEMNVLARDMGKAAGNAVEVKRIKAEMFALAERLGLRGTGVDENGRMGLIADKISPEARQLMEEVRGTLISPEDHDRAQEFRRKSKEQEPLAEKAKEREDAIQKANDDVVKPPEGLDKAQNGATELSKEAKAARSAKLKVLNDEALARRDAKHAKVWAELMALDKDPNGDFYQLPDKFRDIQIGGNATVTGLSDHTLFFDLPGRWNVDTGTDIAQTAGQLGDMAGLGNANDFAGTNERVDLLAIRLMINDKAAKANCVNGLARMVMEGAHMLIEVHVGSATRRFRLPGGATPRVASGFPRERFLGGGDPINTVQDLRKRADKAGIKLPTAPDLDLTHNYGESDQALTDWMKWLKTAAPPPHVGKTIQEVLLDGSGDAAAKAAEGVLDKNLKALDKWTTERAAHGPGGDQTLLQGDEANQTNYKDHPTTDWVIIGAGGTSISAAEIILKQTEDRKAGGTPPGPVKVRLLGKTDDPTLRANTQWQELLRKYGPTGDGRLSIGASNVEMTDFKRSADGKGFDTTGKDGAAATGQGLIVSIGRDPAIPPAFSDIVYQAELLHGTDKKLAVEGKLLFDPVDNQYLGYRLMVPGADGTVQNLDVTGATSRYLPSTYFSKELREKVWAAADRDAPAGAGRFDGGFSSSANQALRYRLFLEELEKKGK